jgi:hypothetical protein
MHLPERERPRELATPAAAKITEELTNTHLPYSKADVNNKTLFLLETAFCHSVTFASGFAAKGALTYVCPICKDKRAHFFIPSQRLKAPRIKRLLDPILGRVRWIGGYLLAADEESLRRLCEETTQRDQRSEKGGQSHED